MEDTLNLSVDVVTTSGIENAFCDEIKGTEVLLYEEKEAFLTAGNHISDK